ncbi:hypothetical protein MHL86_18205 [Brevibacillus laterosporus]|nr:hypothetical protein [Brevibacillus laterosporus]
MAGINGNVDMICMEKDFWNAMMKEQAKYLGELADRVRVASGQEPQNR